MGEIIYKDIENEFRESYLNYAMSVIVSRALPDVRDGLKPVHRRILYSMNEIGLQSNKTTKKAARIVGDVLGKYHPHGDASVYDALVRMAQDFSLRYLAVDGQGNFGSIDGDPPAAMRYTEAKMSKFADLMLKDIDKKTVDFGPNYDESLKEPLVLPSAVPYLLANGSSGIAVGMSTNIPPYNMKEIVSGICALIDNPDIGIDEISRHITGPDFPTGGLIYGREGIRKALRTGRGSIVMRAKTSIEEINDIFKKAAASPFFQGILDATEEELVSIDYRGNSHSSIVDLKLTDVIDGTLIKVVAWYDNEWGYSNRLVELSVDFGKMGQN